MRRMIALAAVLTGIALTWAAPAHAVDVAGYEERIVVSGLDNPVSFTITDSGKIFYGERETGEIRSFSISSSTNKHVFTISKVVNSLTSEQGLLGLALHPDYPAKPYLYAYATRDITAGKTNEVVRVTMSGGVGTEMKVIYKSNTPPSNIHNGGRILFRGNRLFVVIGDADDEANSQNLNASAGKILRMTPNGNVPSDNPFGTRVYASGIRNSFGFAFDPQTGVLMETENGPSCNDELNRIESGDNMGWGPNETCAGSAPGNTNQDGPNPVLPMSFYDTTIAPTGMAFCRDAGCGLEGDEGRFFFGDNNNGDIHRVRLTDNRMDVAADVIAFHHGSPIFSVERGLNGRIYFSSADGSIYKLVKP